MSFGRTLHIIFYLISIVQHDFFVLNNILQHIAMRIQFEYATRVRVSLFHTEQVISGVLD